MPHRRPSTVPRLVAPLLALAAAACAPGARGNPAVLGPEALCREGDDAYRCGQTVEESQLEVFGSRARRDGRALSLRVGEAEALVFEDSPADADPAGARRFTLRDYLPGPGFYVLGEHTAAGTAALLVHAGTGRGYRVDGPPLFAPDGAHFLVLPRSADGRTTTAVQLWRVAADTVALAWSHAPPAAEAAGWSAEQPVWLDARTLRLVQTTTDPGGTRFREQPVLVRRGAAGWGLETAGGG